MGNKDFWNYYWGKVQSFGLTIFLIYIFSILFGDRKHWLMSILIYIVIILVAPIVSWYAEKALKSRENLYISFGH